MKSFNFIYYLSIASLLFTSILHAIEAVEVDVYDDFTFRNQSLQDSGDPLMLVSNFCVRRECSEIDICGYWPKKKMSLTVDDQKNLIVDFNRDVSFINGLFSDEVAEKLGFFLVDRVTKREVNTKYEEGWLRSIKLFGRRCKVLLGQEIPITTAPGGEDIYINMIKKMHPLLAWFALERLRQYAAGKNDVNIYLLQQIENIEKDTYNKRRDFVACIHAQKIDDFCESQYDFGEIGTSKMMSILDLYKEGCLSLGINDFALTPTEKKGIKILLPYHSYYYWLLIIGIFAIIWLGAVVGAVLVEQLDEACVFFAAHPELDMPSYLVLYKKMKKGSPEASKFGSMNQFML